MPDWRSRASYAISLPERSARALFAGVFGAVHESAEVLLPRLVRRSRFYEVTAKNALRIAVELVGGVPGSPQEAGAAPEMSAGRVAVKKAAGNVVEFGSIAAFGFSPLWLLAGAADILNGSRVYLQALEDELANAGVLAPATHFGSVDQLLGVLEGTTGTTARLIDLPPLELSELRRSMGELKEDVTSLPSTSEMANLFDGLKRTAALEDRTLLEVSAGVGLAFLTSGRNVARDHVVAPYREDWAPLRREGFAAYAARVAGPYRSAISGHFDPGKKSITERLPEFAKRSRGWMERRFRSLVHRKGADPDDR